MVLNKETIILVSMCLSGLTFGLGNLDSFPYHVFIIILLGLTRFERVDYFAILSILIVITTTAIIDINSYDFRLFLRQIMNYLSIIVGAAYLIAYNPNLHRVSKVILIVLVLNIIIGFLQSYSDFFTIFSNARMDESGLRGSVGLFSEPTSFGLFCVFCFLFAVKNIKIIMVPATRKLLHKVLYASVIGIVFVNQSSTAILLLTIYAILSMLRTKRGVILFLFLCVFAAYAYHYLPELRFAIILKILFTNDIYYLLQIDGSINERLSAVVGPYYGIIDNYFLPSSAFEYRITYLSLAEATDEFFWWGGGDKIMNYLGNIFYELSILGIFLVYRYVFYSFNSRTDYVVLIMGVLLLSNSVPLLHGYPLLLFLNYSYDFRREV